MRYPNLKKILALDEAFDIAINAGDIPKAAQISAQMHFLEATLTPREQYRFLTVQITKFTENTLSEIDRATADIYNGKDILERVRVAKEIYDSLLYHYKSDGNDVEIFSSEMTIPLCTFSPQ